MQGGQGLVDLGLGGVGVALHGLGSGQSGLEVSPALSGVVIRIQCLCLCNGGSQIGLVYGLGQLDHHKGVLGDADHRGGSIGHSLSGDNGDVVGVFQSVFIGNTLGGQGLNLHLIAGEIHAGDIQLHRAVGFTVHIDQGDVDVPLVVFAGQSGQRGDAVGHGGSGIQLGGHHFVAESGVEHLEDMGGGSGEVLEFPFPSEGAGALLGHHLNDRLLSGAQGVAAGAVPVGQAVLLNVGAAQLHILHHHLGDVQRMGLGAHLGLGVVVDAKLTDDGHFALREHIDVVAHLLNAGVFRLLHRVVIEEVDIGAAGHGAGIGVDGHAVVPLVGVQVVHEGDEVCRLKAGVNVGLVIASLRGIDLIGGVFDGLGDVNEAFTVHGVGGIDVLPLGGDGAVGTVAKLDGAIGIVDHTVGVGGARVLQGGHHGPLSQVAVGAHIDLDPVIDRFEIGVVHDFPVFIQHTGVQVGVA